MNNKSLLTILVCCTLYGCGGGEKTDSSDAAGSTPPVAAPLPAPTPVATSKPRAKPKAKSTQKKTKEETEEPLTTHDFEIEPEGRNFGVMTYPGVSLRDQFAVVSPAANQMKSHYTVVPPDELPGAGNQKQISPQSTLELPEGFEPVLEYGFNADGYPHRIRQTQIDYDLVLIPAGVSVRGSNAGAADNQPAHDIYLSNYYVGVYEVTLGQFEQFSNTVRELKAKVPYPDAPMNTGDAAEVPVLGVPWRDASNFATYYNLSLPSEAQWEKAARGENGFDYPWGNGRPLWDHPRRLGQISMIGSYQNDVSVYGVYDMSGNAREWTNDWYSSKAYEETTERDGSPLRNPDGPGRAEITSHRVIKGGTDSWYLFHRDSASMKDRLKDVGFRCVYKIPEETTGN